MDTATTPQNLRPREAAYFLGVGIATIWRWTKSRPDFPRPYKLGPRVTVYRRGDLEAWRDRQQIGVTAPAGGLE